MLKGIFRLLKRHRKRKAIMAKVREATRQGKCVILAESPEGTRVIILGRGTYQTQLEEIAKRKGVSL